MKISINCGHTLVGADSNGREGILNRSIGNKVIDKLRKQGYEVNNSTVNSGISTSSVLNKINTIANNSGADLFISIHHNCCKGTGSYILTYNGVQSAYTRAILGQLHSFGYKNNGVVARPDLSVLRNTEMSAMIIETCFYDNKSDMGIWNAEKISDSIVKGIDPTYTATVTTSEPSVYEVEKAEENRIAIAKAQIKKQEAIDQALAVKERAIANATHDENAIQKAEQIIENRAIKLAKQKAQNLKDENALKKKKAQAKPKPKTQTQKQTIPTTDTTKKRLVFEGITITLIAIVIYIYNGYIEKSTSGLEGL